MTAAQLATTAALSSAANPINHAVDLASGVQILGTHAANLEHVHLDGIAALLAPAIQKVDNAAGTDTIARLATSASWSTDSRSAARMFIVRWLPPLA